MAPPAARAHPGLRSEPSTAADEGSGIVHGVAPVTVATPLASTASGVRVPESSQGPQRSSPQPLAVGGVQQAGGGRVASMVCSPTDDKRPLCPSPAAKKCR